MNRTAMLPRVVGKVKINTASGCWNWTGTKNSKGYGRVFIGPRKTIAAHRAAFELYRDEIPNGLQLDHLCRNPSCVNPWHLEPVTSRENTLRGTGPSARAALASHCPKGHEYSAANTVYRSNGHRQCRTCKSEQARAYHEANAERIKRRKRAIRARAGRNDEQQG